MTKTKSDDASQLLVTKAYLVTWSVSLLLPLLDGTFFAKGAGGLDVRPLVEEDHRYLFPAIYLLLGSLCVGTSFRVTTTLACIAHAIIIYIRWTRMPIVWDHEQWAVQIELTFFLVFSSQLTLAPLSSLVQAETAFCAIARCQFVLFYGAATFWKLNTGFFDANVSCGTVLILETFASYVPSVWLTADVVKAIGDLSPHKTVFLEGSIATLFAFSSTRHVAVVVGTLFHLMIFLLPVNAAGGFSIDCTSRFIVLFTSAEMQPYLAQATIAKEGMIAVILTAILIFLRQQCTGTPLDFGFTGICFLTAFYLRIVQANAGKKKTAATGTPGRSLSSWSHVVVFVLVMLLAVFYGFLSAILGFQHMGAPTMYSNMRYYGGGNHYLVPMSILSDDIIYGGGLVQVVESTSVALNRRLAYIPSEDVFPPTVLKSIRTATNQTTFPVQFFPLVQTNPQSRAVVGPEYDIYNPVGSINYMQFILPISDLRKALVEEKDEEKSPFVIKLVDAGTSDNFHETTEPPERLVVLTSSSCEIQSAEGEKVDDCVNDRVGKLITTPPTETWLTWLVSKFQTPYPQIVGMKEEICMS
eukprot:scaffold2102_cov161-Amphora_coffeaeformis.AAC.34